MSAAGAAGHVGVLHLLVADDALDEMRRYGNYLAVCGALVAVRRLPPWECPEGCECELINGYCPECVRRAVEANSAGEQQAGAGR